MEDSLPIWLQVLFVCLPVASAIVGGGWAMTRSVSKKSEEATLAKVEKALAPLSVEVAGMRCACDSMKAEIRDLDKQIRTLNCRVHEARVVGLEKRTDAIESHNGAMIQQLKAEMLDGFKELRQDIAAAREGSGLHRVGSPQR